MEHWATILDIIQYGIEGDKEKCRAYTELLLSNLQKDGELKKVQRLQDVLDGKKGNIIHLAHDDSS